MATVQNLLDSKHNETNYSVSTKDTAFKALDVMAKANISALLVKDEENIVGIFTERDYARKGELKGRSAKDVLIKDMMTEEMVTVTIGMSVDQCIGLMLKYGIRHLPVVEKGHLIGLISMRDVVEVVLANKEDTIKSLENYILGSSFAG